MNFKAFLKSFHFKVVLFLTVLSVYLVLAWLPGNRIIAGGDVGIPVWAPSKQLAEVVSSWWESHATGITSPVTFTAIPFYLSLSFLELLGFGPGLLQKTVFFFILAGGSISIYFLALTFNFTRWVSAFAAIYYIFNFSSLTVWQRGVHNAMLMLLLAPLTLLILAWGIKQKKYSSVLLINIVSVSLAYVFGALGYVFSLWIMITIYLFISLLAQRRNPASKIFIIKYFVLLLVSWLAVNAFWIIHLLQSGSLVLGQFSPTEIKSRGSDVLVALKPYHEPAYIFRTLSRFYNFVTKDWGDIYLNPLFILLSWVPTLIVFSTAIIKSNYRSVYWRFLFIFTVVILVLSKGINPPLGVLNRIPYDLFAFLAPLRNPYEKVGILLGIPFSLLFALGVSQLFLSFKERKVPLLSWGVGLVGLLSVSVLIWPLWTGKLFTSDGRKYAVEIPPYYSDLNNFLKEKIAAEDSRVLHLPLAWGESVDYSWDYTGIEPSQYFFDGSSIGYQLATPSVDFRTRDLLLSIHNQNSENLQKAFSSLNIGWIVLHNETVFRDRILESPERINKWFSEGLYFLENKGSFGPLSLWKVKDEYRTGHFSYIGKLISLGSPQMQSSIKIWSQLDLNDGFLTEVREEQMDKLEKFLDKKIIYPKRKLVYSPLGSLDPQQALKEIAIVNHLPGSLIYPLVSLKEAILEFLNQNDQVRSCFSLSGKKLKEAVLLQKQTKSEKVKEALKRYERQLGKCTKIGKDTLSIYLNNDFLRQEILGQLIRQKVVLESEFIDSAVLEEGKSTSLILKEYLSELHLSPKFNPLKDVPGKRIIFTFSVPEDGNYKILAPWQDKDLNLPKIIQIDDTDLEYSAISNEGQSLTYPGTFFNKGLHEIHLIFKDEVNLLASAIEEKRLKPGAGFKLASDPAEKNAAFLGEATSGPVSIVFDLPNTDVESSYELSFDMDYYGGSFPEVFVAFDSDPIDKAGNITPSVKKELQVQNFPIQLSDVKLTFNPPLNSTAAKVGYSLRQSNQLGVNTKALVKNIKVNKMPEWDLLLEEASRSGISKLGSADVTSNKLSQTLYEVSLDNQNTPYILNFSETFHPLWQIEDLSGRKIDLPHLSVNGYANGWLVEEPLPQKIKVKFALQDSLGIGVAVSTISFLVFFVLLKYMDKRKNG